MVNHNLTWKTHPKKKKKNQEGGIGSSTVGSTSCATSSASSPCTWSRISTNPIAKALSKPGLRHNKNTSFASITLVEGSTFRLISTTGSLDELSIILQHRWVKEPSMWYSSSGSPWTSTTRLDRLIMDDLHRLKIGSWFSAFSPMYPSQRWWRLGFYSKTPPHSLVHSQQYTHYNWFDSYNHMRRRI